MARDNAQPELGATTGSTMRHVLSRASFVELSSGGGGPGVIRELLAGERSRRMLLLRAFYDEVLRHPALLGPLPRVEETWHALERAQEAAPEAVTALVMHPQIGSWLAYALRCQAGGATSPAPRYVDFGQLNSLALAAAAIAGQPFRTRVPLRDGKVLVPCFGMAAFPGGEPWDVAEAGTEEGRIWLRRGADEIVVPATPDTDADGWWGLRRLRLGGDPALTVWLDDLDPMRDLADPVPPTRLSDSEVRRWTDLLADAWAILTRSHPEFAAPLAVGVTSLVPLPAGAGWDTRSASTGDAFGAILCSPPPDAVTLAVSLAHEFMHIKLGGLMHLLPLTESGGATCLYAPWRDDPRPLGGLLQGVYAFLGIAAFWRRHRQDVSGVDAELATFEYVYARAQTSEALEIVRAAPGLTSHGIAFTDGIADELALWSADPVPQEIAALARLVADSHRAGWRIRHCRPDPAAVSALANAWVGGGQAAIHIGGSAVLPDPGMRHWSQGRLGLARRRIISPGRYFEAREDSWGANLSDADLALFAGDTVAAGKGFAEQIAEDPGAVDAWTGLALAYGADGGDRAGRVLLARPEVVRAVYGEIVTTSGSRPTPVEVAAWLAPATDC